MVEVGITISIYTHVLLFSLSTTIVVTQTKKKKHSSQVRTYQHQVQQLKRALINHFSMRRCMMCYTLNKINSQVNSERMMNLVN